MNELTIRNHIYIYMLCAHQKLLGCVRCLTTPPKIVDVFPPVEENGLSFYLYCLERRNKTYIIISDKGLQPYSMEG